MNGIRNSTPQAIQCDKTLHCNILQALRIYLNY